MKWDPNKYVQFADHRDRPFYDLTARITAATPQLVVDMGCGPGPLTHSLAERWPDARVTGLDSSEEMIEQARAKQHATNLSFAVTDASIWMPSLDTDVLVSNAMLQWIPEHRQLIAKWLGALAPGAWFAAQVPGNFGSPSHTLMRELANSERWARQLAGVLRHDDAVGEPADYLKILLAAGFESDVWETTYGQLLSGSDPVLEWVRGTALRPVLARLSEKDAAAFEADYARLVAQAYPSFADARGGSLTLFPFRRIFMVGRKRKPSPRQPASQVGCRSPRLGSMKKLLPVLAAATMMLAACSGPSAEDFRLSDQQGNTACIHFGSGYADTGNLGATNMKKAAEHGSKASTEQIRTAVDTDAAGAPAITDKDAFKKACESQGIKFN